MDIFEDAIKNNKVSKTASNQIKNFILENKIF
jgi:hypothetical protein